MAKEEELSPGEPVVWNTSQGETKGKVVKRLTHPIEIKEHHVAASESNPEVLVRSAKSGKVAAHKPNELKKLKQNPNS